MLVAVTGAKGSAGTTTLAYALACRWALEGLPSVFVEADPDGGVVGARLGLCQEPGLSTLAAGGLHEGPVSGVRRHVQRAPGSSDLLLLPSAPGHARAVIRVVGDAVVDLAGLGPDGAPAPGAPRVVVDTGRLACDSPAMALLGAAASVVVVTSPTLEGADAVAVRIAELPELRARIGLVTVGDGPYAGQELARVLTVRHLGALPHHSSALRPVWSAGMRRRHRRGPYLRAVKSIADRLEVEGRARQLEQRGPSSPPGRRRVPVREAAAR